MHAQIHGNMPLTKFFSVSSIPTQLLPDESFCATINFFSSANMGAVNTSPTLIVSFSGNSRCCVIKVSARCISWVKACSEVVVSFVPYPAAESIQYSKGLLLTLEIFQCVTRILQRKVDFFACAPTWRGCAMLNVCAIFCNRYVKQACGLSNGN